jgi:hypothetical protein
LGRRRMQNGVVVAPSYRNPCSRREPRGPLARGSFFFYAAGHRHGPRAAARRL